MGTTYCNNTPGRVAPTLPATGGGIIPGGPVGAIPPVGIDAQLSGGRAQAQADRLERERIARAQVVSDLIVQGRCSEAQAVAMNAGDYAMANKAMGICRAR